MSESVSKAPDAASPPIPTPFRRSWLVSADAKWLAGRTLIAYALSRLLVIAGAGAVAAGEAIEKPVETRPSTAVSGILDVLTSWDGLWYLEIVRSGYPRQVPPDITFNQPEARGAFFPAYPLVVRGVDSVAPGGDVAAAIITNVVLGSIVLFLVGALALRLGDRERADRAVLLVALFPGSFVLTFAYSEATMLVFVGLGLFAMLDERWLTAGVLTALATASRPNGLALAGALGIVALVEVRRTRSVRPLVAAAIGPVGFVGFMWFMAQHTGEAGIWFRIQREAWDEGTSFGLAAIEAMGRFLSNPLGSPTALITTGCVVATAVALVFLYRVRFPLPVTLYTVFIVALMLAPTTVTARPRFMFTAFPLLIAVAHGWPRAWKDWWSPLLALCAGGLVALVTVFGVFGAIP